MSSPSSSSVTTVLSTAATVFTSDTSMVLQTYHQTLEAAILVSAIAHVVRFASSLERWNTPLYSVVPWTMLSTVQSRCHLLAVLPSMPLSSSVQISDALTDLTQGTRPSKKLTKVGDVTRYLRTVSVANDDVLIGRDNQPFQPPRERIVVPRPSVDRLLTALQIRFCHPSRTQLKRIFNRSYFSRVSPMSSRQVYPSVLAATVVHPGSHCGRFILCCRCHTPLSPVYHRSSRDSVFMHSAITY